MSHGYPEPGLLLFPSPSPDSPTHTHIAGRIDKQLDTMEVHKRHVEELWKNALNIAEQLKQVRRHTMHLQSFSVSYEAGLVPSPSLSATRLVYTIFSSVSSSFPGGSGAPNGAVQECGTSEILGEVQSTGGTIL